VPRRAPELLTFQVDHLDPVLDLMVELAGDEPDRAVGWLTLQPAFDAASAPPPRAGFGFFTSRGPYVPVCSWVPGERTRQGIRYTALGVQHGAGGKVLGWLAEQGHPLPEGWEAIADHPSRGLVVAVPPAGDHEASLVWLLHAADLLCPVQLTGEWRASAFRR
jgi:hypothetical protein